MTRSLRLTKPQLFTVLMFLAAIGALLPSSCTRWAGGVLQPLGWLTSSLSSTGRAAADAASAAPPLSSDDLRALQHEVERLRRHVGQQSLTLAELEQRISELTSIRDQIRDVRTRIRLAAVIGYDASPRRETLVIARGSNDGIAIGQWVVACSAAPAADATGRDALMREWLVGRISEVFPFTSRVRLTTDPQFARERVRMARVLADGTWQPIGSDGLLFGLGGGKMQIQNAAADPRQDGATIVLAPASADLPAELTLGRIVGSRSVADAPLFYNIDVLPWGDARRLGTVYVVVPGR